MSRNIVAILRGVQPEEVESIASALIEAGITLIEVPLNSPRPLESIERLAVRFGHIAMVGAGTVLSPSEVESVARAGGKLIVSPNCEPSVIRRSLDLELLCMPGVFTPTEFFGAIGAGARTLKLFPAALAGSEGLRAMRAVLPADVNVLAVGGASADNFATWIAAGAAGFGIGTALYKPGDIGTVVADRARDIVDAYDSAIHAGKEVP